MIKAILSGSFGFDDVVAQVVPFLKSASVSKDWIKKRASSPLFDFDKIHPKHNETLVHLLALGDGETVGANRNGDYFPKKANIKYHKTFLKAYYYHDHDNRDPKKRYGRVVAAAHNPEMGRVELIIGIDNDKGRDDLHELDTKGEFPVSMSCHVPYDRCSICDNKARSRSEYCKHASLMMGKILNDGRQVYVINDHPNFFDISKVWRGADRVAFTFRKLDKAASEGKVISGAELAELLNITSNYLIKSAYTNKKLYLLRKASSLKKFPLRIDLNPLPEDVIITLSKVKDKGPLWNALHKVGICLNWKDFCKLANIDSKDLKESDIKKEITGIIVSKDKERIQRICENGSYDGAERPVSEKISRVIRNVVSSHSLFPEYAMSRIMNNVISRGLNKSLNKEAAATSAKASVVADEYLAYLMSFSSQANNSFVENLTSVYINR